MQIAIEVASRLLVNKAHYMDNSHELRFFGHAQCTTACTVYDRAMAMSPWLFID